MIVASGFGACFEGGGVVQWFVINEGHIKYGFCVLLVGQTLTGLKP